MTSKPSSSSSSSGSRAGAKRAGAKKAGTKRAGAKKAGASRGSTRPDAALLRRVEAIAAGLKALYPDVTCALGHRNDFELLVATILSAQCTDERVNKVTPELFRRFPTPRAMAEADQEELERLIHSTGFFRNKARSLVGASRRISEHYGGKLPRDLKELITLPGVARKTANVVLGTAHGIAAGVVVDTHVKRLSIRLGLTSQSTPEKIERDLMALLPRSEWIDFSHRLIWHGRRVCGARKPRCDDCLLAPHCPSANAP